MKTILTLLCITLAYSFIQAQEESSAIKKKIKKSHHSTFDPDYFLDKDNQHIVLIIRYIGKSAFELVSYEAYMGNVKYQEQESGDCEILYLGNASEELGKHYIFHPLKDFTCVQPEDESDPEWEVGDQFKIYLPDDSKITSIRLSNFVSPNDYITIVLDDRITNALK